MRIIVLSSIFLLLMGCGNPLTRLIPKAEKLEPPAELMVAPKDLKIINKPDPSSVKAENVPPSGK